MADSRIWTIGGRKITDASRCFVIAEVGHNHQGSVALAREMFGVARDCGADAVKLQKRSQTALFTSAVYGAAPGSPYAALRDYAALRAARELDLESYEELRETAHGLGLAFIVTAFDAESVAFVSHVGVDAIKAASGDIRNPDLLSRMASLGIPMLLSSGGASLADVDRAVQAVTSHHRNVALLQCTSSYPCADVDLHLRTIETYRSRHPQTCVGLSSHHAGTYLEPVAYALGARIVEKHFTLSRALGAGDHAMSLDPAALHDLVENLRSTYRALGNYDKRELPCESTGILRLGKKLVAAHRLPAGHILTWEDFAAKGPGDGVPPSRAGELVGRRTLRALERDDDVTFDATACQPVGA